MTCRPLSFAAPPLLLRYQRQSERQTAEVISEEILLSKAYVENIGGTLLGVCTDNASNMRAATKLVPGTIWLGCMAHSAELLSRDLWALFPGVADKASNLENFFRAHAYPRSCYLEEMARQGGSTFLVQPCATRWGTRAKTLES